MHPQDTDLKTHKLSFLALPHDCCKQNSKGEKRRGGGDDPTIRNFYTHQKHDLHSGNKKKTHPKNPTTTTNQTFERLQFAHPKSLKEG
jgi:hypothetical protein